MCTKRAAFILYVPVKPTKPHLANTETTFVMYTGMYNVISTSVELNATKRLTNSTTATSSRGNKSRSGHRGVATAMMMSLSSTTIAAIA